MENNFLKIIELNFRTSLRLLSMKNSQENTHADEID